MVHSVSQKKKPEAGLFTRSFFKNLEIYNSKYYCNSAFGQFSGKLVLQVPVATDLDRNIEFNYSFVLLTDMLEQISQTFIFVLRFCFPLVEASTMKNVFIKSVDV